MSYHALRLQLQDIDILRHGLNLGPSLLDLFLDLRNGDVRIPQRLLVDILDDLAKRRATAEAFVDLLPGFDQEAEIDDPQIEAGFQAGVEDFFVARVVRVAEAVGDGRHHPAVDNAVRIGG